MGTQHPDNASAPYWHDKPFIGTHSEVEEAFRSFCDLGCQEFMWDWEGKHVDEAVAEKLLENHLEFFQDRQLGKHAFLTFRLPNIWEEKGYRIARAFVNVITANDLAADVGVNTPPLFEAILPMTDSAEKLLYIQDRYAAVSKAFAPLCESGPDQIEMIPLIEQAEQIQNAHEIVGEYHAKTRNRKEYVRPFLARSDPALNAGNVSTILSVKLGLSRLFEWGEQNSVEVFPIIGVGSLPFRGGLNPSTTKQFAEEYKGVCTVTVQSAFRYDYPLDEVKDAVSRLNELLPLSKPSYYDGGLAVISNAFKAGYVKAIEQVAGVINEVAAFVPKRRERKLHTGLFGYSRKMGGISLPRAISFTCSLYSLGIPPELIGASALDVLSSREKELLESAYANLRSDFVKAGAFLNKENLDALAKTNPGFAAISKDVLAVEGFLGEKLGPQADEEYMHRNITSNVRLLLGKGNPSDEITRAAMLRKSLG